MRVVVVGASGNAGTSLLEALAEEEAIESVLGLCRRRPAARFQKTSWAEADIERDALEPHFRGADAVCAPRLANSAVTGPRVAQADECRRQRPGLPSCRRSGRTGARLCLVRRGVLTRAQDSARRRELAARGCPHELLRTSQGRGGKDPRRVRAGQPGGARCAHAAWAHLQAGSGERDPPALPRTFSAQSAATAPTHPVHTRRSQSAF